MTSAPRPSVSLRTASTGRSPPAQIAASGSTGSAARSSRSRLSVDQERPGSRRGPGRGARAGSRSARSRRRRRRRPSRHAGQVLPVEDARERLGDRRLGEPDRAGDAVEPVHRQHLGRHGHVLGEAAVVVVADRLLVRGRRSSPAAHGTRHRAARGSRRSPVPGRRPPSPVGRRRRASTISPAISCPITRGGTMWWWPNRKIFDVGAAGGAVAHPDLDVAGPRRRASAPPRCGRHRGRGTGRPSCGIARPTGSRPRPGRRSAGRAAPRPASVVEEDLGQLGQHVDVAVALCRDRHAERAPARRPSRRPSGKRRTARASRRSTCSCARACRAGWRTPSPDVRGDRPLAVEHRRPRTPGRPRRSRPAPRRTGGSRRRGGGALVEPDRARFQYRMAGRRPRAPRRRPLAAREWRSSS